MLDGYAPLANLLTLADVSNLNVFPEAIVASLQGRLPCPSDVEQAKQAAIYHIGLLATVQVLTRVGPVVAEWQKLHFASSFELLRRVTAQLNRISEQLDALGPAGREAADHRYEVTYRDYLLLRFRMTETGTVRITTNMDADLRELFVMPDTRPRQDKDGIAIFGQGDDTALMNLAARELLAGAMLPKPQAEAEAEPNVGISALNFVKQYRRSVIVGTPGSGKSTFLEWMQIKIAAAEAFAPEEYFILEEAQAIPLLLRVRQLDMRDLPMGRELIAKATASRDRADLMPPEWIERQMQNGRVLFMLDRLDEKDKPYRERLLGARRRGKRQVEQGPYFLGSSSRTRSFWFSASRAASRRASRWRTAGDGHDTLAVVNAAGIALADGSLVLTLLLGLNGILLAQLTGLALFAEVGERGGGQAFAPQQGPNSPGGEQASASLRRRNL